MVDIGQESPVIRKESPLMALEGPSPTRLVPERTKWAEKCNFFFKNITLEPTILLNGIATAMQAVILQALVMEQACLMSYNHTESYCVNVTDVDLKKTLVNYNLYRQILETAPCIFLAMFIGSWSDKHGNKLLILIPLVGDALSCVLYATMAYVRFVRPQYLLLASFLQGFTGGNLTFNLGVCSYIIAESTLETRTTRISLTDVAFILGIPIGRTLGAILYARHGFAATFLLAFMFNVLALVYAVVRLRSVPHVKSNTKLEAAKDLFRLQNLKNSLRLLLKKRQGRMRLYIFLILLCTIIVIFPRKGETNIFFIFTQLKFGFTVTDFSIYEAFSTVTIFIGTLIVLPILSYFIRINDIIIAIVALIASIANDLLIAFSTTPLMLYIAALLVFFSASASVLCRSLLTKCVQQDELGKLLAMIGLFGASVPMLSGVLYSQAFNATLSTFPGTCYVMSASLTLLPALCFVWIYYDLQRHEEMQSEQQQQEQSSTTLQC